MKEREKLKAEPKLSDFSLTPGERYSVNTPSERFNAVLVGREAGFLVFKKDPHLGSFIESHAGYKDPMPSQFAVHEAGMRIQFWEP